MERLKIVLADDHAIVLEGMLKLSEGSFEIIGKANNGSELLALSEQVQPDVYVVDVNMPMVDGLEATRKLVERNPNARVLLISGDYSPRRIREGLAAGARGFVSKDT